MNSRRSSPQRSRQAKSVSTNHGEWYVSTGPLDLPALRTAGSRKRSIPSPYHQPAVWKFMQTTSCSSHTRDAAATSRAQYVKCLSAQPPELVATTALATLDQHS